MRRDGVIHPSVSRVSHHVSRISYAHANTTGDRNVSVRGARLYENIQSFFFILFNEMTATTSRLEIRSSGFLCKREKKNEKMKNFCTC